MYLKIIFSCLFYFLSHTQTEKINIEGNWYHYKIFKNNISTDMEYVEMFFHDNKYEIYRQVLYPTRRYFYKKDTLHSVTIADDTLLLGIPVLLNKNTLKIVTREDDKYIVLKRVIDTNTLEDFVNQKIDEGIYYTSYLKREEYWKKYGVLPENGDFDNPPKNQKCY